MPIPVEENPFLGIRGVRVGLEQPELLRTQLRAILAAAGAGAELHIMFPMIATIADWRAANPDLISGDNSAAALLARIQAERATAKPRKRATKTSAT